MGIIAWIVLGAIAGFITNMIMGGREGVIPTIILGIVGAVVGGYLAGTVLKVADVTGINVESIVVAVIGGVVVVAVYGCWRVAARPSDPRRSVGRRLARAGAAVPAQVREGRDEAIALRRRRWR